MNLTAFRDSRVGYDGPVSGTIQTWELVIADVAGASVTNVARVCLPKGMRLYISNAYVYATTVSAATVSVKIGDKTTADSLVANVAFTATKGALTLASNLVGSTTTYNELVATVTNNSTGRAAGIRVHLVGFIASPPTSYEAR